MASNTAESSETVKRFLEGTPELIIKTRQEQMRLQLQSSPTLEQMKLQTQSHSSPALEQKQNHLLKFLYGNNEQGPSTSPCVIDLASQHKQTMIEKHEKRQFAARSSGKGTPDLMIEAKKHSPATSMPVPRRRHGNVESLANFLYGPSLMSSPSTTEERKIEGSYHKNPRGCYDFSEYAFHCPTGVFFRCSFCPHKEEITEWLYVKEKQIWCLHLGKFHRCSSKKQTFSDKDGNGNNGRRTIISRKYLPEFAQNWPTVGHQTAKEYLKSDGLAKVTEVTSRPCVSVLLYENPAEEQSKQQEKVAATFAETSKTRKGANADISRNEPRKEKVSPSLASLRALKDLETFNNVHKENTMDQVAIQAKKDLDHAPLKKRPLLVDPSTYLYDRLQGKAFVPMTPNRRPSTFECRNSVVVSPEAPRKGLTYKDLARLKQEARKRRRLQKTPVRSCIEKRSLPLLVGLRDLGSQKLKRAMFYELLHVHPWADHALVDRYIEDAHLY